MRLERIDNGFQIDATALGPLLGVPAEDVQHLMREGRIAGLHEAGRGADHGRHRVTFRHGATRVRLIVNDAGDVVLRTRTIVAPSLGTGDQAGVEQASEASGADPTDATMRDGTAALPRHFGTRFHARHRRKLDELIELAEMIEDLHEGDEGVPAGIHRILCRMNRALDAHLEMSERGVFPAMRGDTALELRTEMLRDHLDRLNRDCARITTITRNFALPEAACTSWATLYARLAEFIADLAVHIRLENERGCRGNPPSVVDVPTSA